MKIIRDGNQRLELVDEICRLKGME